jgi:hypothetical protein
MFGSTPSIIISIITSSARKQLLPQQHLNKQQQPQLQQQRHRNKVPPAGRPDGLVEKTAQSVAQPIFVKMNAQLLACKKVARNLRRSCKFS